MTTRLIAIGLLLYCWTAIALGQKWVLYAPPEQDFRVLFPAPPARTQEAQGAVAFRSSVPEASYVVYRRDPAQQPIGNVALQIQERLRGGNEERVVKRVRKEDGDGPQEYVFQSPGGKVSIHRVFSAQDRYYELVVEIPREELGRTRATARDFFGSFQIGSAPVAAGALAAVSPDVLCQKRSNAFSRSFCEYSTCLKSQHRGQPYCQKLLQFR
jgi:hypothetical protein